MNIRKATKADVSSIYNIHQQAFDASEADMVAELGVNLLGKNSSMRALSLIAEVHDEIVGHVAFSPVYLVDTNEHIGYILAPLAVSPAFQKNSIGSSLVRHGLGAIVKLGSYLIFVYGDPAYYSRFGFNVDLAKPYMPPHPLKYPEGWHALRLGDSDMPEGGRLRCVDALNNPTLW